MITRFFLILYCLLGQKIHAQGQEKTTLSQTSHFIYNSGEHDNFLLGFNTALELNKQNKFTTGIGTGIEIQSTKNFNVYTIPLFLNYEFTLLFAGFDHQFIFGFIQPGVSLVYQAESNLQNYYPNDNIKHEVFYSAGMGYQGSSRLRMILFFRNQPSNLRKPYSTRYPYLGIGIGYRLI